MSQNEVYIWLKDRRKESNRYYSIEEIRIGLNPKQKYWVIADDVLKLWAFKYLDSRLRANGKRDKVRAFRLKTIYLD